MGPATVKPAVLDRKRAMLGGIRGQLLERRRQGKSLLGRKMNRRTLDRYLIRLAIGLHRPRHDVPEIRTLPVVVGQQIIGARQRQDTSLEPVDIFLDGAGSGTR